MDKYLKIFKALGDKTRLRMVKMLELKEELCVCEIRAVINSSMPTISNHLKILLEAGLVTSNKKDKYVNYRLNKDKNDKNLMEIFKILDNISEDKILEEDRQKTLKANRLELC